MQGINKFSKLLLIISLFFACKKDKDKEAPFNSFLRNGFYRFTTFETPSVPRSQIYYLKKNDFYPACLYPDSICFLSSAGYVSKNDSSIYFPYLYVFNPNNICSFRNDGTIPKSFINYIYSIKFNQDFNSPQFSGTYFMFNDLDTINPNMGGYFEFQWIKD